MTVPAVVIESVSKMYGRHRALDDVTLSLAPGERLALLGHNGAGKTTLIKLILALDAPDRGTLAVLGGTPGSPAQRRHSAYLPEHVAFHRSLSGREQLTLYARLKGEPAKVVPGLLERVGLSEAMDKRIGTYSKGMRQRLGLAQLLLGQPKLVVLDEPTSGLDPVFRETLYDIINELAGGGAAVLLSSHALSELEAHTDRIAILSAGKLVADDPLKVLRANARLPIRLRIEAQPKMAGKIVERFGGARINGRSVELTCDIDSKLEKLAEITALGATVSDIDIVLPNLEDIYRHYSGGRKTSEKGS